jgi:hypothetical protein
MSNLSIPRSIIIANPNWDAVNLETIFLRRKEFATFPSYPFDDIFVTNLKFNLQLLKVLTPYYFEKYMKSPNDNRLLSILISASRWSREEPIKEIICWSPSDRWDLDSDEIDRRISTITGTVSFSLCKVLRPLSMILDLENGILTNIEMGAFRPTTKRLIELGLPREIAIKVAMNLSQRVKPDEWTDSMLFSALNGYAKNANFWENRIIHDITKS